MRLLSSVKLVIWQVRASWNMTADVHSFFRLSSDFLLYRLLRVMRLPGINRLRSVKFRNGSTLTYRLNRGDIWIIYEVWLKECYRLPFTPGKGILVDLGANIGLATLWYANNYDIMPVLAVEAAQSNAEIARKNFVINDIHTRIVEAAVGPADGKAIFMEYNWSTYNALAFDPENSPRAIEGLRLERTSSVEVHSMPTLLSALSDESRIALLKIDIEGGEQALLRGEIGWLDRVDAIVAEFHPPDVDPEEMIQILFGAGFNYVPPGNESEMHCFRRNTQDLTQGT